MTLRSPSQPADTDTSSKPWRTHAAVRHPQPYDEGLPHAIGLHLPLPGKVPGWPKSLFGQWRLDPVGEAAGWLEAHRVWRREHMSRIGYDDAEYRRPELAWSQRNFVHTQMMVEDRYFYDPVQGRYTVDRYLDDLEQRFGGLDSVLIWWVYPNIGIDDRNQLDMAHALPGGVAGLKQAVADFHRRGVKVFLPTMPWDHGTRDDGLSDCEAIVRLAVEVGADGINGDTYGSVPRIYAEVAERLGHPLVLQPEVSTTVEEALRWNLQSWGKPSAEIIPAVSKLKWLEPRHTVSVENRWSRDRTDDLHYIFFNGIGYVAWENVWGIWNGLTARDGAALRRIAAIERRFAHLITSADWAPYATTLQQGVFASLFPGEDQALWTVVNRNEYAMQGEQLAVPHEAGARYFDLWNGVPLEPYLQDGTAILSLDLETRGFGCVLALDATASLEAVQPFLDRMKVLAQVPLSALSKQWTPLAQQMVELPATAAQAEAPEGMVAIPGGDFLFQVAGIEIEGATWAGLDVQYPWEPGARRSHRHRMAMRPFHIDRHPVTHGAFERFIAATGYRPADAQNFLRDWTDGQPPRGWADKPVTWVSIEDARAYAAWAGKRLPHEWEWQYAAQGTDGRRYPWGDAWRADAVPAVNTGRGLQPLDDVGMHPEGASPFGVEDLVGTVWQWTDEFHDEHTRAAVLRGGSAYQPQSSHWYFPQAHRLDQHGKYLLMAPGRDRSGMVGFRCVVDAQG
jgi:iron(II)-dependent oxidoreductase